MSEKKVEIPRISSGKLQKALAEIRPLIRLPDGSLCYIQTGFEPRQTNLTNLADTKYDPDFPVARGLKALDVITTYHRIGSLGAGNFTPTFEEVAAQILKEGWEFEHVTAFEVLTHNVKILDGEYHETKTILYGKARQ